MVENGLVGFDLVHQRRQVSFVFLIIGNVLLTETAVGVFFLFEYLSIDLLDSKGPLVVLALNP